MIDLNSTMMTKRFCFKYLMVSFSKKHLHIGQMLLSKESCIRDSYLIVHTFEVSQFR